MHSDLRQCSENLGALESVRIFYYHTSDSFDDITHRTRVHNKSLSAIDVQGWLIL